MNLSRIESLLLWQINLTSDCIVIHESSTLFEWLHSSSSGFIVNFSECFFFMLFLFSVLNFSRVNIVISRRAETQRIPLVSRSNHHLCHYFSLEFHSFFWISYASNWLADQTEYTIICWIHRFITRQKLLRSNTFIISFARVIFQYT